MRGGRPAVIGVVMGILAITGVAGARAAGSPTNLIGSSCRHQLELTHASGGFNATPGNGGAVSENHALDSRFMSLTVTETTTGTGAKPRHVVARWSLGPKVKLCTSRAQIGFGNEQPITQRSGVIEGDVTKTGPVRVKIRAALVQSIRPRQISRARMKALITGWAARACRLETSDPGASELLSDLAGRGHAHGCKGPGDSSIPSDDVMLTHLSAYYKQQRGGAVPTPATAASMGREYYRVLAQLTTGAPTP